MYKFAKVKINNEPFSSGHVLLGVPGTTSFPVRLADEIYQRSKNLLGERGVSPPFSIYDPLCGLGNLLTIIGFLHRKELRSVFASDINRDFVEIAKKNLSLLSRPGLLDRREELRLMHQKFGKKSHERAVVDADLLLEELQYQEVLDVHVFKNDALSSRNTFPKEMIVDMVFTDLPYGKSVEWITAQKTNPAQELLNNLFPVLSKHAVVCLVSDKRQTIAHDHFTKIQSFKLGKRKVLFLLPAVK